MARYVGKRIVPKHCGVWDRTRSYEMDCIVYEQATGDSYISRKEVPAGTALTQEDYWALCARFSEQMALLRSDVKADVKEMHDSLEETEAAVNRKTDSAVDTMTQRTQAAEKLTNTNKSELNSRMDNMEKRLDANVTASTTPSGDYAAEVVDARVGWDDTQYDSLGSAIRGQLAQGLKYAGYLQRVSGSEDMNDMELNTVYLISSNAGETGLVNFPDYKGNGVFITVGMGTFTYQIFFGGGGDRVFIRYRSGTTWANWRDFYRDIDAEFENLYQNLELIGAEDYLHRAFTVRSGEYNSNGVRFTFNADGSVTVDGTATGADSGTIPSFYNMYAQLEEFPKGMHPGGTYIFRLDGTDGNVLMEMFLSRGGEDKTWERFRTVSGPTLEATLPEDCTGFLTRISVLAGKTANSVTVYPSITPKETPEEMFKKSAKFAGVLYRNSGTDDLNELEVNTVYTVSSSEGATTLVNFPDYVGHGLLMTLGSEAFHYQIFFGGEGKKIFLRCRATGGWRDWKDYSAVFENEFDDVYHNLSMMGGEDILHRFFKARSGSRTVNGVTFTVNSDGSITADGTAEEKVPGFYNMYSNYTGFPEGIEPGGTYVCRLDGDVQNAYQDVYLCHEEGGQKWTLLLSTQKTVEFTIPEGTYGFLTRIMVPAGKMVENARVYPSITRKFTPEEYFHKAEEQIAESLRYTGILNRISGTEDMDTLPVNSIYLVSSNTGETTLVNFPEIDNPGIMITSGVDGGYTYQIFVGTTANSMFLRFRYGTGEWADWRKITDLSDLTRKLNSIREQLFLDGVGDKLYQNLAMSQGTDKAGVMFTLNNEGTISVNCPEPLETFDFHNLYVKTGGLPQWQRAGENYICGIHDDTSTVSIHGYWYNEENKWVEMFKPTKTFAKYTVPEEALGVLFRLELAKDTVVDTEVTPYVRRDVPTDDLKYTATLNRISGTEDLNDLPVNSIYLVSSNTGETSLLNFPDYNGPGILISAGVEGGYTYQIFIGTSANSMFLRFRYGSGIWADWRKITDLSGAVDSFRGTNPNSHMLSYGNSILSGSVWKNQKYDHLAAYYNAPYGVIANAIGIPKENVKHTVVSSTGLLYDAGQGSFLENIKKNDLAGYDVVLTHLWTADMSRYQIGTESATAGDGTIAGGVVELINYMKESNGGCQLILVGVPPTSTSIYGEAVFTGKQPDGSSIAECDELMHKLAKKYHFVFLDWEGLNLAYYYHSFSDGMNVHANNEDTYRIMGAYLGGRASMEIRF